MGTERQPVSTSPPVTTMMALLPLLSLATTALAAPPMADLLVLTGREAQEQTEQPMADYGSDDSSEAEDFANLTMSRAAEERAINTCNCAPVSSSDGIV